MLRALQFESRLLAHPCTATLSTLYSVLTAAMNRFMSSITGGKGCLGSHCLIVVMVLNPACTVLKMRLRPVDSCAASMDSKHDKSMGSPWKRSGINTVNPWSAKASAIRRALMSLQMDMESWELLLGTGLVVV